MIVGTTGGNPRLLRGVIGPIEWSPNGQWLLFQRQVRFYRVARNGGEPVALPPTGVEPDASRFSRDGQSIYFSVVTGPRETLDVWKLSLHSGAVSRLTKLEGRRGSIADEIASDSRYLYFIWREDEGDIWVMDVVPNRTK
jgi:Tol biopolymer transport system component